MTEAKLPDELEEQAILHALEISDHEGRQDFLMRLQGESDHVRQTAAAYQAVTEMLAITVPPVTPPAALRERLVKHVALEVAREAEQFELVANTVAFGSVPVIKPQGSVRERLLSRIETDAGVQLKARSPVPGQAETHVADSRPRQFMPAWRHLLVTVYTSMRLCWKALENVLRTLPVRSKTSTPTPTRGTLSLSQGLTFIKAVEGVWRELAPGVTAKVLSFDTVSRRATTLLRIAPGTSYAPHRHTEMEELFVLEGGCRVAGREMTAGDYHRAEAGTEHHDTSSDDGCLLLIISSPQNEML